MRQRGRGWQLSMVDVTNFKSIQQSSVAAQTGMTAVTGPNGSGKSNLLEAIGFALGVDHKDLRVSALTELAGTPSLKTTAQVTFSCERLTMTVGCTISEGQRTFRVNGAKVSREKHLDALTSLGFAKDSICWFIRQKGIQDVIGATPAALYRVLCFASGTHQLVEAKTKVDREVLQLKAQAGELRRIVDAFNSSFNGDALFLEQLINAEAVQADIDRKAKGVAAAEEKLRLVAELGNHLTLQGLRDDVTRARDTMQRTAAAQESAGHPQDTSRQQLIAQLLEDVSRSTERCEDLKQLIDHNRGIAAALHERESSLHCHLNALVEEEADLRNQRSVLMSDEAMKQTAVVRLSEELEDSERSKEAMVSRQPCDGVAYSRSAERAYLETNEEHRQLVTSLMTITALIMRLVETESNAAMQAKTNRQTLDEMRGLLSVQMGVQDRDHLQHAFNECSACCNEIANEEREVLGRLNRLQRSLRLAAPTTNSIVGDLGTVADLVGFRPDLDPSLRAAVMSLLEPFLNVRVCESNAAAAEVLQCEASPSRPLRIWVIERLESARRSSQYDAALRTHAGRVLDPATILTCDCASPTAGAMVGGRIAGSFVALLDADLVTSLLRMGISCITRDGNKHSLGSISLRRADARSSAEEFMDYKLARLELRGIALRLRDSTMQLETIRQQLQQQQARAQTHVDVRGVEKRQVQLDREASSYGEELSRKQRELDCLKLKCAGLEQLRDVKKAAWERCRMSLNEDPAARTKFVESETSRVEALKQKLIAAQSDVVRASDKLARCEERLDQIADLVSETRGELSSIGAATVDATALAQDTQAELESELSLLNGMKSAYDAESKTESERLASAEAVSSAMELQTRAMHAATKRLKEFSVTHAVSNDILTTLASKFGDKFKDVAVLDVESVRVSCERAVVAATSEVEEARAKVKAVQALVRERRRTGGDVEVNVALERSALEVKRSKLAALNSKSAAVLRGVELLEHGILGLAEVISNRHERIYTKLRAMVSAYFAELVPGKQVDLVLVGDALENGLQLVLQSSGESSASISSLSGGERALLALSLLFASGLLKKSPIYLLDEVDAALDEANIHLIASVVHNIFADSQTLCVSHHADFHSKKFNNIRVSIKDGFTIIG